VKPTRKTIPTGLEEEDVSLLNGSTDGGKLEAQFMPDEMEQTMYANVPSSARRTTH